MRIRVIQITIIILFSVFFCAKTQAVDIFRTLDSVPATPTEPLMHDVMCHALPESRPLELDDVISEAICVNPQARKAWADARAQAAALGIADAAYLPVLNATIGAERDTLATTYDYSVFGVGARNISQNTSSKYGMLNLSWMLVDFGRRGAIRRQARALLAADIAIQNDALQTVFFNAAKAFYALLDADISLDAAQQIEKIAYTSLAETIAKHKSGAGTLADELQARTSYQRATLDRVSAEGDLDDAIGSLAVVMGLDADTKIKILPPLTDDMPDANTSKDINATIEQLIDEAKKVQPKLVAARAILDAARANVDVSRTQNRPAVSLVGNLSQNNPSYQQQPQSIPITRSRGSMIGIQINIPLFEGFASKYRIEQAQAQVASQEEVVRDTELQVSLDVWKSYRDEKTDASNFVNSESLLDVARHAFDIARGRYKEGVGTFTEVLTAQTALGDAQKQRVLAISKWRVARLKLAESLGKLRLHDVNQ
ncbi:outer membrane bacteriocin efflux protein [Burkholderia lata]|uniref:Protein CyaE n=1 Tax=Burkholderia lata (strain ATCC 17760 / DSM 23089 / LMG 22485 / NCIMB 9086 / R18194 / 383) TaxID=482957 RepID=A0A6P2ZLR9_BURL3|nr:TolC family protein [Burkholderia lata]VWD35652.1 outer membrane bacteriocin efflux protein [Burkholderia lata]